MTSTLEVCFSELALPRVAKTAVGTSAMMPVRAIVSKLFVLIIFSPNGDLNWWEDLDSLPDNRNGHANNSIVFVRLNLY